VSEFEPYAEFYDDDENSLDLKCHGEGDVGDGMTDLGAASNQILFKFSRYKQSC
jgi:hypothetical protein